MKQLIMVLLMAWFGTAWAQDLKDIPEMPIDKISQRMEALLKEDVNLVYDNGRKNADALAKLIKSLRLESFYEVGLAFYGLKNHAVTSNGERVDYLAARHLDALYGVDEPHSANQEKINQKVLDWAKWETSLLMAMEGVKPWGASDAYDLTDTYIDFSYVSHWAGHKYAHAGNALIISFANPYEFPIKIHVPSFKAIKQGISVIPPKAAAKALPDKKAVEKEFTVVIAPHTFYEHRIPLSWLVDDKYEGKFKLDSHGPDGKRQPTLFYHAKYCLCGDERRPLRINAEFTDKFELRVYDIREQRIVHSNNPEYVNICHTVMKYLDTYPETPFAKYFLADIPEKVRKTYNPDAKEFANYKEKLESGRKYGERYFDDDPNPCEHDLQMRAPDQRGMNPITTLAFCNAIVEPLYYLDVDDKILKSVMSFDSDEKKAIKAGAQENGDDDDDEDEEDEMLLSTPFIRKHPLKSHAAYFRDYFNTKLSSSDTFFFLSAFDFWPLFDRSFYLFDQRLIEQGDLRPSSESIMTPIIDPMQYVGKPICDFAAALTSQQLTKIYPKPRPASFFRKFYSLLDMHICRKNLVEFGLATVSATPVEVRGKTFAVAVKYANASIYPLELFLESPHLLGIRNVKVNADDAAWGVCQSFGNQRHPERVVMQPGESATRIIPLNRLGDFKDSVVSVCELGIDLYARVIVPEMEMDFPEPFGTRIKANLRVPVKPLNPVRDADAYTELLTSIKQKLASDPKGGIGYTQSMALIAANMLAAPDRANLQDALDKVSAAEDKMATLPWAIKK